MYPLSVDKEIIDLYKLGLSASQILDKLSLLCHKTTIYNILKRNNIYCRDSSICNLKYKVDYNFFERIDTEEKAYWLGFIVADGCVYKHTITITLHSQDKDHLHKFLDNIKSNHKIYNNYYKDRDKFYPSVSVTHYKLIDDLSRYGVISCKTFKTCFPNIPTKLQRHFIRGVFDGDGCINKTQKGQLRVHIAGTKKLLNSIQKILCYNCSLKKTKFGKKNKSYILMYAGNKQIPKIMNYLYNNSSIYLNRKYDQYLKFYEISKAYK